MYFTGGDMPIAQQQWLPLSDELSLESVYKHTPEDVDYVFKIADCTDELLQAYSLLYKEYLNAGYVQEDPHELLFTPHHLLPQTKVFIAKSAATVLSTATLVHDSRQFGLPMDALYPNPLDADQVNQITANRGSSLPKLPRDLAELLQSS
jgi:hypothetical protein